MYGWELGQKDTTDRACDFIKENFIWNNKIIEKFRKTITGEEETDYEQTRK